ncbi:unnamed protein product [Echinostoma caproni]|uniref:Tubulin--tyrosine ligase-like protein 9 n=1 Tax=Echinostoma caproni TaxID=27848 RepID=A0A183AB94_9TREM|nr:unnamed protein product [Echinostoma caproni]
MWISKPIGWNQGKGIFLVRDLDSFNEHLEKRDQEAKASPSGIPARIVQKYIENPLLLDGRKFDIRCYMLIANSMPYLVLYHPGYVRLSMHQYSSGDPNLLTHLTNQYIQKKDPNYVEVKNDTVWTIDRLNDYVNKHYKEEKKLPENWVQSVLQWRIQRIIYQVFLAVKNRLATRIGLFQLFGLDFMLDQEMRPWLLEVNSNPAMATNCDVLKDVLPDLIQKTIHITLECFEKAKHEKPLLPLTGNLHPNSGTQTTHSSSPDRGKLDESKQSISAGNILRTWIVPRYKPPILPVNAATDQRSNAALSTRLQNIPNDTLKNTVDSATGQGPPKTIPLQAFGITVHSQHCQNARVSGQETINQSFVQKSALSDKRPFEQSLRRYAPMNTQLANNKTISTSINTKRLTGEVVPLTRTVPSCQPSSSLIFISPPQVRKGLLLRPQAFDHESSEASLEFEKPHESPACVVEAEKLLTLIIDSEEENYQEMRNSVPVSHQEGLQTRTKGSLLNRAREPVPMACIQLVAKSNYRSVRPRFTPNAANGSPNSSRESRLLVNPFNGKIIPKNERNFLPDIPNHKSNQKLPKSARRAHSPEDRGS